MCLYLIAGFSAQPIFTTALISTFNLIFTATPIVAFAVLEQDLSVATILANPETYTDSRTETRRTFFWRWLAYMGYGVWHSLPVFFLCWYTLSYPDQSALAQSLQGVGSAVWVSLILVVTLKLAIRTRHWNWISHVCYWLSLMLLLPFIYVVSIVFPRGKVEAVADMTAVAQGLYSNPVFWLAAIVCAPAMCLLPDLTVMAFKRQLRPSLVTLLQVNLVTAGIAGKACLAW